MKVIKRTNTKTDIINTKSGERIYIYANKENEVSDKYKNDIINSILYKTGGLQIIEERKIEERKEAIGSIELEGDALIKQELLAEAEKLGIRVHPNAKISTIKNKIEEAKLATGEDEEVEVSE
jgi:hypothetical protein